MTTEINSSSVTCKEVFDEGYQPSKEEINDYAIRIGILPEKEPHLLHLAKDGLMQALPPDWKICYHKPHAIYYYNTKSKDSQWDHPLDVVYKKLVEKARLQYQASDRSEDTSQIDSGIKSLHGNEDSDQLTDVSYSVSQLMEHFSPNTKSAVGGSRFLAPIDKKCWPLQPIEMQRNKRFEVISYNSSKKPMNKIDLNIKTDEKNAAAMKKNEKEPLIKSLTLSGTGSMFLKTNTQKLEDQNIDRKSTPTADNLSNSAVKGILRDSSLTDVRNKTTDRLSDTIEGEDRKSVRFNLEKSLELEATEISKNSSDNDLDNDGDDWDFREGDDDESHGKRVQSTLTNNFVGKLSSNPVLKSQSSVETIRKPQQNKLAMFGRTFSTDSGHDKSKIMSSFDGKLDKTTLLVRPLYEDTDSESTADSIKDQLKEQILNSDSIPLDVKLQQGSNLTDLQLHMKKGLETSLKNMKTNNETDNELQEFRIIKENELEKMIMHEQGIWKSKQHDALVIFRLEQETKLKDLLQTEQNIFDKSFTVEKLKLEANYKNKLSEIATSIQAQTNKFHVDLEEKYDIEIENLKQQLQEEFEIRRNEISNKHRAAVEILQRNHTEILQDLERDLKTEEDLLKKDHATDLSQLKDKLAHELELEKQRMRESGENHLYEKIRCEKRLLEDKYRCLKEKYIRLKSDVKISLERRSHRRAHQSNTTGSETERTLSNKQSIGNNDCKDLSITSPVQAPDHGKPPAAPTTPLLNSKVREKVKETNILNDKKFGAAARYISLVQRQHDDTTSFSQSDTTVSNNYSTTTHVKYLPVQENLGDNGNSDTEACRRNHENNNNSRDTRKKLFTRMKSASTSRLNSSNKIDVALRPCTPIENLRRQLQKLEDLEDQFPDNTLDTTYHLRYPFKDVTYKEQASNSSELEFFKHRIHMERDSVRRAKESLRSQRTNFRIRQREIKQRHKSTARHTMEQLIQEEKELTEMEVSLHRTRALLGEKVIRLRHLELSLQRLYDKENPIESFSEKAKFQLLQKEDATISDLSSHSSSGFSSTDYGTETNHTKRNEISQESADIIQSLEQLNAEVKEIWEILSKQRTQGLPPPPAIGFGWPILSSSTITTDNLTQPSVTASMLQQSPKPLPTFFDRLETYRQITSNNDFTGGLLPTLAANTIVSQSSATGGGYTTSIVERTQDLRNWLKQAKNEHELLTASQYQKANL